MICIITTGAVVYAFSVDSFGLQEDMQHGYFDDFRAVRDQHGKIFSSPERLIDAQVAQPFPPTQVVACPTLCLQDASCALRQPGA